jgi:hypothetical protein
MPYRADWPLEASQADFTRAIMEEKSEALFNPRSTLRHHFYGLDLFFNPSGSVSFCRANANRSGH